MRCRGPAAQQGVRRGGSLYGGRWRADGPHISQETKNPDPSGMGVGPRGRGRAGLSAVGNRTRDANTALSRRFRKRPECPRGAPKRPLWRPISAPAEAPKAKVAAGRGAGRLSPVQGRLGPSVLIATVHNIRMPGHFSAQRIALFDCSRTGTDG